MNLKCAVLSSASVIFLGDGTEEGFELCANFLKWFRTITSQTLRYFSSFLGRSDFFQLCFSDMLTLISAYSAA